MKSFNQFTENLDKAAAIRQRQQDTVSRFKQSGETQASVHSDRLAAHRERDADKRYAKQAAIDAAAEREQLKKEIKQELKSER